MVFFKSIFSRKQRLLTKTDFKQVFDNAKKISQKHLLVLYKTNNIAHARLGLSVGKRIAPSAVKRNRIKRVIRESFRNHCEKLKGIDIIVVARQQCDKLSKKSLREGIDKLWETLKVIP